VPKAASGLALPGLFRATVAVTDDGHGVAQDVIALLNEAGASAVPAAEATGEVSATIFLGGLRSEADVDDVELAREAFRAARNVAGRGAFVTVVRAGRAGPGALARTCAREWPDVAVKSIELEHAESDIGQAAAIVSELLTGDAEPDIVVHVDGSRTAWAMVPSRVVAGTEGCGAGAITPESVIVITGGARGVTAACARALARTYRPRIALIGRTSPAEDRRELRDAASEADLRTALIERAVRAGERPRPVAIESELSRVLAAREVRETLADLEAAGSPVRYLRADVGDIASLRAAMEAVRAEWGPITGVVHGAGVLADRRVQDKSDEQFDRVLRVKAEGFKNLLELVEVDEPGLVCAFSSATVSAGNPGQCDYAAANEIVERLAVDWRARHPRSRVKTIAWGPWSGGMVTPELAEVFAEREVPLIPLEAGAAAFLAELGGITGPTGAERADAAGTESGQRAVTAPRATGTKEPTGGERPGGFGEVSAAVRPDGVEGSSGGERPGGFGEVSAAVRPDGVEEPPARCRPLQSDGVRCLITAGSGFPGAPLPRGGEVLVSEVAQAWLADHRIGGRAVVPLAVVCDWMLRLADPSSPGGSVALHDVEVLRGIAAPAVVTILRSGSTFTTFTVTDSAKPGSAAVACYRARLGSASPSPLEPFAEPEDLPVATFEDDSIYDGTTLFHGAALRTLTHVHGIGPAGAVGSVVGALDMDWPDEPWRTDPASLDGAIQLAVVWARARIGWATLPMSLRTGVFAVTGAVCGPLRCVVRAVRVGGQSAVCDLRLSRPDGTSVVELRGLELVARPR
jgi:NAD(P)-dependent dehydrogenase (short-subunit alcohol dehydrogenase family)